MISEAIEILKTYTDGKDNTDKVEISVMQLNRIIKALEQQPTDAVDRVTIKEYLDRFGNEQMTAEDYRQRMMQAFHNADCGELIAVCVLPTEKEFEHLEWLLKNHYKKEPCEDCDAVSRQAVLDAIMANCIWENEYNLTSSRIKKAVESLPSVTPKAETVTEFADRCRECGAKYGKLLKQEPCDDAISRHAVIEITAETGALETQARVKALPPVTPQPLDDAIKYFDAIKKVSQTYGMPYSFVENKVKETAKALKALEQEPCGDAISRQKAIDAIDALYLDGDSAVSFRASAEGDALIGKYQAITALDDLPPVTPQPKMGRWIVLKDEYDDVIESVCSCCDKNGNHKWAYCPNCGCKMQEVEE